MSQQAHNTGHATPVDRNWQKIYIIGGIVALLALAGTLSDIILAMIPGWEATTTPTTMQAWFTQLYETPLLGLRNLDMLNMIIWLVEVPLYLALFGAHRKNLRPQAALALIVVLAGKLLIAASNAALPMLALSGQYAQATETQQLTLEAAGQALLARGAHGSMGVFLGFFLSSLGSLLMNMVMIKGGVFTRITGWIGVASFIPLLAYVISETFIPQIENVMMLLAMPGGLLVLAWYIIVARRLLRMGREGE